MELAGEGVLCGNRAMLLCRSQTYKKQVKSSTLAEKRTVIERQLFKITNQ
jgi:hypothetical protein